MIPFPFLAYFVIYGNHVSFIFFFNKKYYDKIMRRAKIEFYGFLVELKFIAKKMKSIVNIILICFSH